jgi:hypothetical protein
VLLSAAGDTFGKGIWAGNAGQKVEDSVARLVALADLAILAFSGHWICLVLHQAGETWFTLLPALSLGISWRRHEHRDPNACAYEGCEAKRHGKRRRHLTEDAPEPQARVHDG